MSNCFECMALGLESKQRCHAVVNVVARKDAPGVWEISQGCMGGRVCSSLEVVGSRELALEYAAELNELAPQVFA